LKTADVSPTPRFSSFNFQLYLVSCIQNSKTKIVQKSQIYFEKQIKIDKYLTTAIENVKICIRIFVSFTFVKDENKFT